MNTQDNMETKTPEVLYEEFMGAADQFDAASANDTRQEWMDAAVSLYEKLANFFGELTEPQQKRINRTIEYLNESAAESE